MNSPQASAPRSLIVFNVGSSSIKYRLFAADSASVGEALAEGRFDRQADVGGSSEPSTQDLALIASVLDEAANSAPGRPIEAAGHRIVHGGREFLASVR